MSLHQPIHVSSLHFAAGHRPQTRDGLTTCPRQRLLIDNRQSTYRLITKRLITNRLQTHHNKLQIYHRQTIQRDQTIYRLQQDTNAPETDYKWITNRLQIDYRQTADRLQQRTNRLQIDYKHITIDQKYSTDRPQVSDIQQRDYTQTTTDYKQITNTSQQTTNILQVDQILQIDCKQTTHRLHINQNRLHISWLQTHHKHSTIDYQYSIDRPHITDRLQVDYKQISFRIRQDTYKLQIDYIHSTIDQNILQVDHM